MNKVLREREVLSSPILYHPGRKMRPIMLGVVFEFATKSTWAVGLAIRQIIDPVSLEGLDNLSRELIVGRLDIIRGEIDEALLLARKLGDVVHILSSRNGWSFNVGEPSVLLLPKRNKDHGRTLEKLAEEYALLAFMREIHPVESEAELAVVPDFHQGRRERLRQPGYAHINPNAQPEIPKPWMLPPVVWRVPVDS